MNNKFFEWTGVTTAILYSLFVALNIGIEFIGFSLLLISAILIGIWAYRGKHKGIFLCNSRNYRNDALVLNGDC